MTSLWHDQSLAIAFLVSRPIFTERFKERCCRFHEVVQKCGEKAHKIWKTHPQMRALPLLGYTLHAICYRFKHPMSTSWWGNWALFIPNSHSYSLGRMPAPKKLFRMKAKDSSRSLSVTVLILLLHGKASVLTHLRSSKMALTFRWYNSREFFSLFGKLLYRSSPSDVSKARNFFMYGAALFEKRRPWGRRRKRYVCFHPKPEYPINSPSGTSR